MALITINNEIINGIIIWFIWDPSNFLKSAQNKFSITNFPFLWVILDFYILFTTDSVEV